MNNTPDLLAALRREIASAPVMELAPIIAALEGAKAEAYLRMLTAASGAQRGGDGDERNGDDLQTIKEVAERLHVSTKYVQNHAEELGGFHVGRAVRFPRRAVDAYVKRKSRH